MKMREVTDYIKSLTFLERMKIVKKILRCDLIHLSTQLDGEILKEEVKERRRLEVESIQPIIIGQTKDAFSSKLD